MYGYNMYAFLNVHR